MSLIGLDIGSSSTKAVVWSEEGAILASHRQTVAAKHPAPGVWEVDPDDVWKAVVGVLRRVAGHPAVRHDTPRGLAVSASGREVFLADAAGLPLTPCVMAGDARGEQLAARLRAGSNRWAEACGHLPERMDPAVRMLWWRDEAPSLAARARKVLGWHELITLRLTGVATCDASLASRWLTYDMRSGGWSSDAFEELELDPSLLPEIAPWGAIIGEVSAPAADHTGLPKALPVATGAFDVCCAAVGLATQRHEISVACGTWQAAVIPASSRPSTQAVVSASCTSGAFPSEDGLGVFSLNPDCGSALDWAARLTGVSLADADFRARDGHPSPVSAFPWLSEGTRGRLSQLSLATTPADIVAAIAEAIVYELAVRVEVLAGCDVPVYRMRATGGGARSPWWMQLFADVLGCAVEVGDPEATSLGAAMLAGVAVGTYASIDDAHKVARTQTTFDPCVARAALHAARRRSYRDAR